MVLTTSSHQPCLPTSYHPAYTPPPHSHQTPLLQHSFPTAYQPFCNIVNSSNGYKCANQPHGCTHDQNCFRCELYGSFPMMKYHPMNKHHFIINLILLGVYSFVSTVYYLHQQSFFFFFPFLPSFFRSSYEIDISIQGSTYLLTRHPYPYCDSKQLRSCSKVKR